MSDKATGFSEHSEQLSATFDCLCLLTLAAQELLVQLELCYLDFQSVAQLTCSYGFHDIIKLQEQMHSLTLQLWVT